MLGHTGCEYTNSLNVSHRVYCVSEPREHYVLNISLAGWSRFQSFHINIECSLYSGTDYNCFTSISNCLYSCEDTVPLSFVNARYTRGTIASCVWRYHITSLRSIHSGHDDAILEPTDPVFSQFTRATTAQQTYIVMDVQQHTKLVRQRAAAMSSLTRIQTYIYAGERKMNDLQTGYENLPSIF